MNHQVGNITQLTHTVNPAPDAAQGPGNVVFQTTQATGSTAFLLEKEALKARALELERLLRACVEGWDSECGDECSEAFGRAKRFLDGG